MATLFFDGFDRATVLRKLDPNYWSTQYPRYPQYAFGGYTYDHTILSDYTIEYKHHSVNNGIAPTGIYTPGFQHYVGFNSYINIPGNNYPGFGQPPGFLAITNIPINDVNNLEPLTYLQLSGFPEISGTKSYFGIRTLGIETKHADYTTEDYPLGRFGDKHPFLAFCSGNHTGLLLSFVAITGDHLLPLIANNPENNNEGRRISIGLQVEQNSGVSGIFDMNMSDTLQDYRITPPYIGQTYIYYPEISYIPTGDGHKILTIARTTSGPDLSAVISRWTHLEFEIDHLNGRIRTKIEGADALVENKNENIDREDWDISINISGFMYDNIRLFNRTYYANLFQSNIGLPFVGSYYYMQGALSLYDDITLVHNTGNDPIFFLGHDSKVLPLHPGYPGVTNRLNTNANTSDGLLQWNTNASSARRALMSVDQDISVIETDTTNKINAIRYYHINNSVTADANSVWRVSPNDGVAGMKVYNSARKNFLDSSFVNVVETGISDIYRDQVMLLLHAEEYPMIDYSRFGSNIIHNANSNLDNRHKFGNTSVSFQDDDAYLIASNQNTLGASDFTIEAWVQFTGINDSVVLFDRTNKNLANRPIITNLTDMPLWYSISCSTGHIAIDVSNAVSVNYGYGYSPCATSSRFLLPFPSGAETGVWHHIALTRQFSSATTGWYTSFLNGSSGTGYIRVNVPASKSSYSEPPYDYAYECPGSVTDSSIVSGRLLFNRASEFFSPSHDVFGELFGTLRAQYYNAADPYTLYNYPYIQIGGSGLIDELRWTSGLCRYKNNFSPPNNIFKAHYDDYLELGPSHTVERTLYKTFQYYQMDNPANSLPWTSGNVFTSGLVLGVKKI